MKISAFGFTLVELLVVVAAIAIISAAGYTYQASTRESQKLKIAANTLQSMLREAQTYASARRVCNGVAGATWMVHFDSSSQPVKIECQETGAPTPTTIKSYSLEPNIQIASIYHTIIPNCISSYPTTEIFVEFSPLYGNVTFDETPTQSCPISKDYIKVQLENTKTTERKDITIDKGGFINLEQ